MLSTRSRILLLAILFVILATAQGMAQAPAAASSPVPATADFLASLAGPSNAPVSEVPPAPSFLATTGCTSSSQCPTGQLCCYACGTDCERRACMKPLNGHCPFFP
jgi:hypothetical protein